MNRFAQLATFALLINAPISNVAAQATTSVEPVIRSATKARDIGGFSLGMSIKDAAKLAKLEAIGGGQFNTEVEGVSYNFEVTPLGRIFRIQSSQQLGRFAVDEVFAATVLSKLSTKYGPPSSKEFGSYGWHLAERVGQTKGPPRPATAMWMSAYLSNGPGVSDVSLEMKMITFAYFGRMRPRSIGGHAIGRLRRPHFNFELREQHLVAMP